MATEIAFQLTRRELDALVTLEAALSAEGTFDFRTVRSLVNKGLVTSDAKPALTHAGSLFLSFTRACGLSGQQAGRAER